MAEAIGVAASGIALAEVAGKIVTTSLAIKRLIDDVKELPETFRLLLDQIDVLTPVLVEASSDTATGSAAAPSPMDRALDAAAAQCSKALDQLKSLASELSDQIEKSRGFRRKVIAVKIALHKDAVAKHEKRLDKAVQLLLIAQQTYILYWFSYTLGATNKRLTCIQDLAASATRPHSLSAHSRNGNSPRYRRESASRSSLNTDRNKTQRGSSLEHWLPTKETGEEIPDIASNSQHRSPWIDRLRGD